MAPRKDLVLILDLETTGAKKADPLEQIVQVGVVALRAPSWEVDSEFDRVILPDDAGWERMMSNDVVREMHEKSGLLPQLRQAKAAYADIATASAVDDALVFFIKRAAGNDTSHIPYGGSGVSHFDRAFIERQLPRLDQRITYWSLDVGVARRMAAIAGRTDWPVQDDAEKHDALNDARFHAREFRFALSCLAPEGAPRPWEDAQDDLG